MGGMPDPGTARLPFACTEEEFAEIAEQELEALPDWIKQHIEGANVAIGIETELSRNPHVLGLYQRLGGESVITLYRFPIIRAAGRRRNLRRAIHDTLLHEIGHLFGMTEADLDHYSIGNDPLPDAAQVRASELTREPEPD
jgi:predicted Zn-dependent protease with MMP-like domain